MDPGVAAFVLIIIAMLMVTAIITTWIQAHAKAGFPTEEKQALQMMCQENAGLRDQVRYLEERIVVLEQIATDPAQRTARDIERLR